MTLPLGERFTVSLSKEKVVDSVGRDGVSAAASVITLPSSASAGKVEQRSRRERFFIGLSYAEGRLRKGPNGLIPPERRRCSTLPAVLESCSVPLSQQTSSCVQSENGMGCFGLA